MIGEGISKNDFFREHFRILILLGIILVLSIIFSAFNPVFLELDNIMNIAKQTAVLAIIGIGMTFVILTKGIDLSVGSVLAVSGAVGVIVLVNTGSVVLAFLTSLIIGGVFGLINGLMVGFTGVSPFMISLAIMALARGLTLVFLNALSIRVENPAFLWLGSKSFGPIPVVLILVILLYLFFNNVLNHTVYGRRIYAVGGNKSAAESSGIKTKWVITSVYLLTGILTGLGSIVTVGRLSSAQPWAGNGLEFEVITAVVLGGTSLQGGEGTLKGTFLGALIVGILANGLGLMEFSPYVQYIVKGVMILFAVLLDNMSKSFGESVSKSGYDSHLDDDEASVLAEGGN